MFDSITGNGCGIRDFLAAADHRAAGRQIVTIHRLTARSKTTLLDALHAPPALKCSNRRATGAMCASTAATRLAEGVVSNPRTRRRPGCFLIRSGP